MPPSSLQVFLPAEHDAWTLLAIDLQALAFQSTRSPYAHLRALQVGLADGNLDGKGNDS